MQTDNDHNPSDSELLSIREVVRIKRKAHPNCNRWLFGIYIVALISWLVIRYALLQPVATYFKELIAEQRTGLRLNEVEETNHNRDSK